ncbi:MAG: hypothetical protein AAB635_01325 [Patescibacteria group bacterium]
MINIAAVGLYMLLTGISGNSAAIPIPEIVDSNPILVTSENRKEESTNEIDVDVEARVREYFSDMPILAEVARCESHFTQTGKNGKIMRGIRNPSDVGVMQINERYHTKESKKLNIDIYTLDGNLAYARYLYEKQGARPWMASSGCWAQLVLSNVQETNG